MGVGHAGSEIGIVLLDLVAWDLSREQHQAQRKPPDRVVQKYCYLNVDHCEEGCQHYNETEPDIAGSGA